MSREDEEIGYEDIKGKLDTQKRAQKPVHLRPSFYEEAQDYLEELREEYERAHSQDPGSKEVRILFDELFRGREALNDLFDLRAKRILAHALSKSGELEEKDLTSEERELFHSVREEVEAARARVLERAQRGGEHKIVRILEDVPTFTAADLRIYTLEKEDLVTLPDETASVLVDKGKAAMIGQRR